MNQKEALRILTDDKQLVLDSIYPCIKVNEKWKEAFDTAVESLRKEVNKNVSITNKEEMV